MEPKQNLLPGIFLFLFLVLLASLAMYVSQQPPNSLPASAPPAEFSAERAFRHIEALARQFLPKNKTDTVLVSKTFVFNRYN